MILKKLTVKVGAVLLITIIAGLLVPQRHKMPVQGATKSDYNPKSFWYYPWGKSITHKGIDIFAKKGTPIHSSTMGMVLYAGEVGYGGKFVLVLGPKWRLHYYAHLDELKTRSLRFVSKKSLIGTVGNTGKAKKHTTTFTLFHILEEYKALIISRSSTVDDIARKTNGRKNKKRQTKKSTAAEK